MKKDHPFKWRLSAVMEDLEVSNGELAELTGMHPTTISKLRRNLPSRLDMKTLAALCEALQCQPGDLLVYRKNSPNR